MGVITCDEKYLPIGLMLPMAGHYLQVERGRRQCALTAKEKALLWEQTVCAKIRNQASLLEQTAHAKEGNTYLLQVLRSVNTDNATQKEAQAARHYWTHLFGMAFRRARFGAGPNAALNDGSALLPLPWQGLVLSVGIHHHNRYNAFALADDMMEPYRPLVDLLVYAQQKQCAYEKNLTQDQRHGLMTGLATQQASTMSLDQAVERTASTYIDVLQQRRVGSFFQT